MKSLLLLLLTALAFGSGCVTKYRVTLTNGSYYATYHKPHFDQAKNRYVFTDTSGAPHEFSPLSISEIAPEDMHEKPKTEFLPSTPRQ
jgi:hypothetical protein